jgi:hypothetical protein
MMYPASEATEELAPRKITAGVINLFGVMNANQRIKALKKPNFSASPIPSIATKISGSAGIWAKFRNMDENIQ